MRRALDLGTPAVTTRLEAAARLLELGDFAAAAALYEGLLRDGAAVAPALEALGRLCLWRGDAAGAVAIAGRLDAAAPGDPVARRLRAAAAMLNGAPAAARALLDGVVADAPRDGEAWLWRAEANLRLGDRAAAIADADRSLRCQFSFAARAVRLLAALRPGDWIHDSTWQELAGELTAICPDAPARLATNTSDDLAELLERALAALRGNRSPHATWVRDDGTLALLPPSSSIRLASRRAMELVRLAPAAVALQRLDALVAAHPSSAMPLVHRGELRLWLGDYAAARADLEGAIAVHRHTRWAWYGLACLDLVAGDPERALATCAEGIRVMNDTEGPVAFLYRGEAYRLLGRLDEARQQLERSCALHQSRLSAWINLALVHAARGDRPAQAEIVRRLARVAPALLAEAAAALGEAELAAIALNGPLAEQPATDLDALDRTLALTLRMMRGNRSSSVVTYFTADGVLRHVPQSLTPPARGRALARLRDVLLRVR
ncbi:MAG: tetratricopeptide repeat protein [Candidatus Binatia bacterium]